MTPTELVVLLCVAVSVAAFAIATLGLFRLPDLYARAHATSKADTLGVLLAVAGAVAAGGAGEPVKLVVLLAFVAATTPTATHAIVNAAAVEGYDPWTGTEGDGDA